LINESLLDLQDKKKATIMVVGTEARDKQSGELLYKLRAHMFIKGIGGFGHKGKVKSVFYEIPERKPDAVVEELTRPDQAFLYRLNGHLNPLHVDPDMSIHGGFKVPILHGLCFYGITAKAVFDKYC